MSKDFRAKQVRTNKIIGRSDNALGGTGTKIQLALMKSGSANFAGGLTSPGGATPDVGRLKQIVDVAASGTPSVTPSIGEDVWMVVDGNSAQKYERSPGESVLFLGNVVVSGTLYAERQRINVTTYNATVTSPEEQAFITSGSIFVNQGQGISVGRTLVFPDPGNTYTDPRGSDLINSVFWAGDDPGGDNDKENNSASPLLYIRPDDAVASAADKLGRIGIGTATPAAKLEISGPVGGGDDSTATHQFKITHSVNDYFAIKVDDSGVTTLSTNDHGGAQNGELTLDADGDISLDAGAGDVFFKDSGTKAMSINMSTSAGDAIFKDAGDAEIFRIDGSADSLLMSTDKKIEFRDAGIYIHSHEAAGLKMEADGNMLIGSTLVNEKTLTLGNAASTHINLKPSATAGDEKILIKNATGDTDGFSNSGAILIEAAVGGIGIAAQKNIVLEADGGLVKIADNGSRRFLFDGPDNSFTVYNSADNDGDRDYFKISVGANGATQLTTHADDDSSIAHMTLLSDGNINFDTTGGYIGFRHGSTDTSDLADEFGFIKLNDAGSLNDFQWYGYGNGSNANLEHLLFSFVDSKKGATNAKPTFRFNDDIKLEFRDNALTIHSSANGQLDINADTELQITAPTVDIDASSEVNISNNLVVGGNLTVSGATTTISTTNLDVEDAIIVLQAELGSATANASDLGIIMERGSTGDNAAIIWDEGADKFLLGTTAETGADTDVTVAVGTVQVGKLEIDGATNHIDVSTDLIITAAADVTFTVAGGNVTPTANNGAALGSGDKSWSNLFIGVGGALNFKNSDVTLTHVDTVGLLLNGAKQLQFGDAATHIKQSADSHLEIQADGSIILDAPTIDLQDDGVILAFGDDSEVTLTHVADTGLKLNSQLEILSTTTQQKWSYDANSFATITVADASHTTLATGESGNFILDSAGNIELNANGGIIELKDNTQLALKIDMATSAGDAIFKDAGDAEIFRIDSSADSILMAADKKIEFRDAHAFINSSASKTLNIQAGQAGSNDGTINIGTTDTSTITIGESGVTTTAIHGLSLANAVSITGDTGTITFNGADPDAFIKRNADGDLFFKDASNGSDASPISLSTLASLAVSATTVFTTQGGDPGTPSDNHRNVTASTRRIAIIGSGSVGGVHADEIYGFNGLSSPSDAMFFVSGSIKPIGKYTDHGDDGDAGNDPDKFERRNAAFDCNLVSSGSVFLRGLYHTNGAGDITEGPTDGGGGAPAQSFPHPIEQAAGVRSSAYVLSIDQVNAVGAGRLAKFGMASLHGHLNFSYSEPDVRIPANGLSFTDNAGSDEVMLVKPSTNTVIIPANKKLSFANPERSYIKTDGNDLEIASNRSIVVSLDKDENVSAPANEDAATFVINDGDGTERFKVEESGVVTAGSLSLTTDLAVAHGGTGASNASAARTNLGLVKGIADGNVLAANDAVADDDFLRINGTEVEGRSASEVLSDIGAQAALTFGIGNGNAMKFASDAGAADNDFLRIKGTDIEGRSAAEVLSDIGGQAALTFGIGNGNAMKFASDAGAADDDFLRIKGTDIEGLSAAEMKAALDLQIGTDVQAYDAQLSALALFTAAQVTRGIANENLVTVDDADATDNDYAKFTSSGIEGRSYAEVRTDLGLSDSPTFTDSTTSSATQGGNLRLAADDGAAMASGHRLGVIEFAGAEDASNNITVGARIEALCDALWSATENGTDLLFYTTDGNASQTEKMRILANGNVGIGDPTPSHKLSVNGTVGASDLSATTLYNTSLKVGRDADNLFDFDVDNEITVRCNGQDQLKFNDGAILPITTDIDLGSSANRFANIYTNDLNLCNEGRGNDVDGTSGNWTIQEGEENLYVINNLTGKKYKMALTPVDED